MNDVDQLCINESQLTFNYLRGVQLRDKGRRDEVFSLRLYISQYVELWPG